MASDPRKFLVKNCSADINSHIQTTTDKKTFFDNARFLGGIEGTGPVGDGLRALVSTSDVIGSGGNGPLPSGSSDDLGADYVMGETGINPTAARTNASLNPNVVNRGVGSAKQVWQKVKAGQYNDISDLPDAVADLKNLKTFTDKIFTPPGANKSPDFKVCHASPYAMDLIARAPKSKFLFVVQFTFSEPYVEMSKRFQHFAFVIKQSDRPTVQFDYDDINMYNFKTKVIRKSTYNPIGMRFYDDITNEAMHFYNSYLRAVSPISNMTKEQIEQFDDGGMNFNQLNQHAALGTPTHNYSASAGPLLENQKTVLREITLFHVFDGGRLMNSYHFFSPKILELQMDELSMAESGEGNEIGLQFSYDGLYIEPNEPMNPASGNYNLSELTKGGNWPLRYASDDSNDPNATTGYGDDFNESFPQS
jgi:arginyl-tRNA--protein-N-Asp/Glu arginylyltransferase